MRGHYKQHTITQDLADFLATQTHFYMATADKSGQPYIQHRGGPAGFLRVLGPKQLGFADFTGNRQYISRDNLGENNKVALFLIDYPTRQRIKIMGTAQMRDDDSELTRKLADPNYRAPLERAVIIDVAQWDVNCPSHITPRYDAATVKTMTDKLQNRISELEAELAALKG